MSEPLPQWVPTPDGTFRLLEWDGREPPVLFLHGLTGVAEVWGPTIDALGASPPRCLALDQRGHGHSTKPKTGYSIGAYVRDAVDIIEELGLAPLHLVGHSMGARVAMVLAARFPRLLRSVAVVDIGPEAWRANYEQTVQALDRMPPSYPNMASALGGAARARGAESADAVLNARRLTAIAEARLRALPDGSVAWLADREALKQTVVAHRSRDYWAEWKRIGVPALFVRGGTSAEVRPRVAAKMRATNPGVRFVQFEGVGHNVPLLVPERLAATLLNFWSTAPRR